MPKKNDGRKKHKHQGGASQQAQASPPHTQDEHSLSDEPVRRSRRYYDDSDDMIERVRRVRAAFEKRIHGFQGADWPHYVKRTIIGKKKMEQSSSEDKPAVTGDNTKPKSSTPTLPFAPDARKEHQ